MSRWTRFDGGGAHLAELRRGALRQRRQGKKFPAASRLSRFVAGLGQIYGGSFISKSAVPSAEPILLDVTRLIELRWTGRQPNGIDRVCLAYARHVGRRARAVVQHRGVLRVLNETASLRLFDQLVDAGRTVRSKIAAQLVAALATPRACSTAICIST